MDGGEVTGLPEVFPPEIWHAIAAMLPSCQHLSLTNRAFRALCQPLLFDTLTTVIPRQPFLNHPYHAQALETLLIDQPAIAPLVRALHVSDSSVDNQHKMITHLRHALHLLSNLNAFHYRKVSSLYETPNLWLDLTQRDHLHHWALVNVCIPPAAFMQLNPTIPQLHHLTLEGCGPTIWTLLTLTPQLRTLTIARPYAPREGGLWFHPGIWLTLLQLTIIDMGRHEVREVLLDSLPNFVITPASHHHPVPALEHLTLDCGSLTMLDVHALLDALRQAPRLHTFRLLSSPDDESESSQGGHALFDHLALACPHLSHVLIFRGNGYELVPWLASLSGYANALMPMTRLESLCL